VEWSAAAKWRPFCSERCRLIDLGAWLTEKHAIPGEDQAAEVSGESAAEPGTDDLPRH
jgi:endogenous inhibitor of DNA gyrase (YacG/DUF329 family)